MKRTTKKIIVTIFILFISIPLFLLIPFLSLQDTITSESKQYWLLLYRHSNKELLYYGVPGEQENSNLLRSFSVKTGIPSQRPTPLPSLVGREYWNIINAIDAKDNVETAPFFLTLDIPHTESPPYGPKPYSECNGQCNWIVPGAFGLHGVASDNSKISVDNEGSSGCIRHTDEDITFLYNLLNNKFPIRYYIIDA